MEIIFDKGYTYKHFNLKWFNYDVLKYVPVTDSKIMNEIIRVSKDTYLKLNLDSYIRYDIRMDTDNNLYVIDANPYPAIFYPKGNEGCADSILRNSTIMDHLGFVEHNIKCAKKRAINYQ